MRPDQASFALSAVLAGVFAAAVVLLVTDAPVDDAQGTGPSGASSADTMSSTAAGFATATRSVSGQAIATSTPACPSPGAASDGTVTTTVTEATVTTETTAQTTTETTAATASATPSGTITSTRTGSTTIVTSIHACPTPSTTPAPRSTTQAPRGPTLPVVDHMPFPVSDAAAVHVANATLLIGVLQDEMWRSLAHVLVYNGTTTLVGDLPWSAATVSATSLDGAVYVFGESGVARVNGSIDEISTTNVGMHSNAVTLNGTILVFPQDGHPLAFDPVHASFDTLPGINPVEPWHSQQAAVWNDRVLLQGPSSLGPLIAYAPSTGFQAVPNDLPADLRHAAIAVVDDALYAYGGVTGDWTERVDIWRVDLRTGLTEILDVQLPSARPFATAVVDDGVLLFGGGFGPSSYEVLRHDV